MLLLSLSAAVRAILGIRLSEPLFLPEKIIDSLDFCYAWVSKRAGFKFIQPAKLYLG